MRVWCAICLAYIDGDPHREPLGKGGAMVNVCTACATETPVAWDSEYHYEVSNASEAAISRIVGEEAGPMQRRPGMPLAHPPTRGWRVVRVSRAYNGKSLDAQEAAASLRGQPWFAELRYLGTSPRFFLFERPDPRCKTREASERQLASALAAVAWLNKNGAKA